MADKDVKSGPIPVEVLRYWEAKGLKVGFDHRDVWEEEHDLAFTAAKVMREDVLETMSGSLEVAFAEGQTFEQWKKNLQPDLEKQGWWKPQIVRDAATGQAAAINPPSRLRTIFRTNMRTARAAGQDERIQRNKRARPYLMFTVGPSAEHREEHLEWHGIILPVDDPWWDTHTPPLGYGCKCSIRTLSKSQRERAIRDGVPHPRREPILDKDGLPTGHVVDKRLPPRLDAPTVKLVPWENKRTGEVELVPEGIQPGFQHRPGVGRRKALKKG